MWKPATLLSLLFCGFSAGCGDDEPAGGGGAGGSGASSADGGGGSSAGCAPDEVLAPLNDFLSAFDGSSSALAGHAGSFEATGFFLAPGLPGPTSIIAEFFSIFMGCTEAVLFDPACVMGRCTQLECTGRGGGWINHYTL